MQRKAMVNFTTSILLLSILIISLLQFSCSQKAYPNVSCIPKERRALLQFRNSLVDGSNRLPSWSGKEDCCNWGGVGCNRNTGHVVKLDLRDPNQGNSGFQGEINSSLLALKHLNYLDLSMNNFSGIRIPVFFGSLKILKYLNLSFSGFVGNVPRELGNLSHLQHVDLSSFGLTAESMSWVAKLSSLRSLDLSHVNLNGSQDWFKAINMLPSLIFLKLTACRLHSLPNLPHVNLTSLSLLDLSVNFFNSTIPIWLFNLTSLKHLDLSENLFHGLIPVKISQLISLTSLNLGYNHGLMTPLPNSLGSLSSLHYLDLSNNTFGGSLPLSLLCNLTSLIVLNLGNNKFQGSIPREIGCFRQLIVLRLYGNELNGTIHSNLGLLTNLECLDISFNSLIDEISEVHFVKLKKLKFLALSYNTLTLKLRSSWIPPFQVQEIWMVNVRIGLQFPTWLQTQKNLNFLTMSNASISDDIPDWFEIVHSDIKYLDLSFNNITGKIPKFEIKIRPHDSHYLRSIILSSNKFEATSSNWFPSEVGSLDLSRNHIVGPIPLPEDLRISVSLTRLHLNDNYFNGSIPESICHISTLQLLDISNNQLSGRLPLCLGNLQALEVLKLGNNSLYGQIPSSLGNIKFLQSLCLNNNKFHGKLPLSMQYLLHMQFLDLGENELEGFIPSWIGKHLSKLRILMLQSNHFYGDVPIHLCQLSRLQLLNLAHNNLTGFVPSCFNNFSAMGSHYFELKPIRYGINFSMKPYYVGYDEKLLSFMGGRELEYYTRSLEQLRSLDLSQNNIIGGIPNELMDLVGLQSLNLSRNHLSGHIPQKIGNLKELLSLDLSMNELSGSIPTSLASLNFLSYLNLSSNRLSGRIPMGNQLQTLDDPSIYAGNNGLCGKPLFNNCSHEKSAQKNEPSFQHKDDKESNFSWFYAGFGPGFSVGILMIFCILLFKKSWRIVYFQFVENFANNIWISSVSKASKLQRRLP